MKILVTGGSGFIGKRLIKALDGEITIMSRSKHPFLETLVCDLASDNLPSLEGFDIVFHLAGIAHDLRENKKNEEQYYEINVKATTRLAKAAIRSNVGKFIFVSSVKAGGSRNTNICETETSVNSPEGIYGRTKFEAEESLLRIVKDTSMHTSIIRPALVYGPNAKGNLNKLISAIKTKFMPRLPEIRNKKSMIHIDDLIRAIIFISNNKICDRETFIATDGNTYSTYEILTTLSEALGISLLKWTINYKSLNLLGSLNSAVQYKIDKLMSSECYSSEKLKAFGFTPVKTLININETDF